MATGPALFRRPAERELVRDIVKDATTIEGALKTLEDSLDPPIDSIRWYRNSIG